MNFKQPKLHCRNFFIKDEMLVPALGNDLRDKFPRGIQGLANPCTNMALGPFMHTVSSALASCFDGPIAYTSGRTPEEIGDWYQDCLNDGYTFYEDDFSAFDSTQGAGAHYAEVAFYKLFNPPIEVLFTLEQQKYTKGFSHYYKYETKYTRKSGDQNTSIGNTIINMMAHLWAIQLYNTRNPNHKLQFKMLALGDDNLMAVKNAGDDFAQFINVQISKLGLQPKCFKSKFAPTYCSSVFVPVLDLNNKERYVLVPEVIRKLTKMSWTVTNVTKKESVTGRLKSNELSQINNSLMPVSRAFHNYYVNLSVQEARLARWETHKPYDSDYHLGDNTREWFTAVYGVSWSEVQQLEDYLHSLLVKTNGKPCFWNHPIASQMYQFYNK
jgi:hypothetical protein